MKKSVVVNLISETYDKDSYGVTRRGFTSRKVFAKLSSVSSQEWFDGGRNGLNPQYRFTMFSHDYKNEKILEYDGVQYTIYRTYLNTIDEIDLYTELKKGNE